MAESDFTALTGSLSTALVDRNVSNGFTPPSGGGSWVYGFHSLQPDEGASGMYYSSDPGNFAPMAKGGRISCPMKRLVGVAATPFLFMSLEGNTVGDSGYLIGLAHDESPARLIVVKGPPSAGLLLANQIVQSSATYQVDDWLHLQVDIIRQPSDDVLIKVWENDLAAHAVSSPTFVLVPGMEAFTDDNLGIITGSQPFLGGYCGFGYYTKSAGRYAFHDYFKLARQL
jgi:hypothetical protein